MRGRSRPSSVDASADALEELECIVGRIRERWPTTRLPVRGAAGSCRDDIMARSEESGVAYMFGLACSTPSTPAAAGGILLFTSNKPLAGMRRPPCTTTLTEAILERVLERGRTIALEGPSMLTRHEREIDYER